MDNQLSEILARRKRINTGREPAPCRSEMSQESKNLHTKMQGNFNPYTAFPNLSRKQVKEYEKTFKDYDTGSKGFLDIEDVKKMMEFVGKPQTHLQIKKLMSESLEKEDSGIVSAHPPQTLSFFGFLSLFENPDNLEDENSIVAGMKDMMKQNEVDVHETGVSGAKNFFAAKINAQSQGNKAAKEIRKEQEERKVKAEEEKQRKSDFKARMAKFNAK